MDLQRLLPRIIFVSITILSVTSYVSRAEHQLNDQEGSGSDGFMSSGDYSGSGSGSGSGEFKTSPTKQPDPLKCVLTSDSDSLFYPTTQDEVVLEAKCRSLCIEKVSSSHLIQNSIIIIIITVTALFCIIIIISCKSKIISGVISSWWMLFVCLFHMLCFLFITCRYQLTRLVFIIWLVNCPSSSLYRCSTDRDNL